MKQNTRDYGKRHPRFRQGFAGGGAVEDDEALQDRIKPDIVGKIVGDVTGTEIGRAAGSGAVGREVGKKLGPKLADMIRQRWQPEDS